jgi:PAS domain S-box-containing protein
MGAEGKTREALLRENEELRRRLTEAEETLSAIRSGEVDAIVVSGPEGEQVFTLKDVDYTYRRLIEEMQEGAVSLTPEGTVLYCNEHFATMLKRPLEKLMGFPVHDIVAPADLPAFEALMAHGSQESTEGEVRLRAEDGTLVPVYLSFSAVQLEDVPGLCMVATDLTEQKRTEEIVAAERLSRCILDQATDAIVVCDKNGKIIRASQMVHQLCDQNPLEQPFESVFPLQIASEQVQAGEEGEPFSLDPVLRGMCILNREAHFVRSDGHHFDLLINAGSLVNGAEKEIIGCVITLTDITERKRTEKELKHLNLMLLAVRNINQLIAWEKDRDTLMDSTCNFLNETIGNCGVWIALLDDAGKVWMHTESGLNKDFRPMAERLKRGELPDCADKALSQSDVVVIQDTATTCGDCPLADGGKGGGALTARIEHGGKVYRVLCAALSPEFITLANMHQLFREVAGDLGFALRSFALEEERKRAEEALKKQMNEIKELNQLFVGREHRMIELKGEVNALLAKLGEPQKYTTPELVEKPEKDRGGGK